MKSEEFSGYRPVLIKQDIYSDMWAYNMFGLKIIEKNEKLQSSRQSKNGKYIIKDNFNKVIGSIKNTLMEYLVTTDEIRKQELLKYMDDFIVRAITYVKIDKRQFKRKKPVNKSAMSYRKTSQVSTTLNGRLKISVSEMFSLRLKHSRLTDTKTLQSITVTLPDCSRALSLFLSLSTCLIYWH